jgi:hypothetical protein
MTLVAAQRQPRAVGHADPLADDAQTGVGSGRLLFTGNEEASDS